MSNNSSKVRVVVSCMADCVGKKGLIICGVILVIACVAATPPPVPYTGWVCYDKENRGDCVPSTCLCQQGVQQAKCCAIITYSASPPCKTCSPSVNNFDPKCDPNGSARRVPATMQLCQCINEAITGSKVRKCVCDPDWCDAPIAGEKVCNC